LYRRYAILQIVRLAAFVFANELKCGREKRRTKKDRGQWNYRRKLKGVEHEETSVEHTLMQHSET